jgi:hypothetical protein
VVLRKISLIYLFPIDLHFIEGVIIRGAAIQKCKLPFCPKWTRGGLIRIYFSVGCLFPPAVLPMYSNSCQHVTNHLIRNPSLSLCVFSSFFCILSCHFQLISWKTHKITNSDLWKNEQFLKENGPLQKVQMRFSHAIRRLFLAEMHHQVGDK